jgi:hypothetical protein
MTAGMYAPRALLDPRAASLLAPHVRALTQRRANLQVHSFDETRRLEVG